eukprot:8477475-Pyramimonas_sp.AAC.1
MTPVLHPPPKLTATDGASLQLGSHRRDELSVRVSKAYLTASEGTSLQLEIQRRCPWTPRAPQRLWPCDGGIREDRPRSLSNEGGRPVLEAAQWGGSGDD